jgi:glucokinase
LLQALDMQDALAQEIWDETVDILGSGLASVINLFNPRLIILGGGIINFGERLFGPVRRIALSRAMKPLAKVADIVPAQLGAEVGIIGAAAVVMNKLQLRPVKEVTEGTYGGIYA